MKNTTPVVWLFPLLLAAPAVLWAQTALDYRNMGEAVAQKGLYAKAVNYYQQAVAADPNDWQAYQDMGDAYLKMNDNVEALNAYQKSLAINPNNNVAQAHVNSLTSPGVGAQVNNPPPSQPATVTTYAPGGQFSESQPITETRTVVIKNERPYRRPEPTVQTYNDGLAPIDHAKIWTKFELGYDYSSLGEFTTSANAINNGTYVNPATQVGNYAYSANAVAPHGGLDLGFELGFLLDTNNGLALGIKYTKTNDYTANIAYQNPGGDYEDLTLSSYIVPLTLDYYLFLPDSGGRFFLTAGAGYYFGSVHVNETVTSYNYVGNPDAPTKPDTWTGDLTSGNLGFQVGFGREFAVNPSFGIEVFARGRYLKITNYRGTLNDPNGYSLNAALATGIASTNNVVDIDGPQYINNTYQEKFTTVDYTGFEVGASLNFYSF